MSPETTAFAAVQAVALLIFVVERLRLRSLRAALDAVDSGFVDPGTGLLTERVIPLRLDPEVEWATWRGSNLTLVGFGVEHWNDAVGRTLELARRAHEAAFLLDDGSVLVVLSGDDAAAHTRAVNRLTTALRTAGAGHVRCATVQVPTEASSGLDAEQLLAQRLRPRGLDQGMAA